MQPIHYYFRHLANVNVHNEFYNFFFLFPLVLTHSRKWCGQGRSALWNPRILKQSICHAIILTSAKIIIFQFGIAIFPKGRRPFISDDSRFHNGWGRRPKSLWCRFIRFCVGNIDFLARLTARSKVWGQGRSALCNSSSHNTNFSIIQNL